MRSGGTVPPRRGNSLEEEAKNVPPGPGGRWDKAHRRVVFVDDGDVVMVDAATGTVAA